MKTYTIAAGKAVTTKRGLLGQGEAITARDVPGGQKSIDALVKAGAVDESKEAAPVKSDETVKFAPKAKRSKGKK